MKLSSDITMAWWYWQYMFLITQIDSNLFDTTCMSNVFTGELWLVDHDLCMYGIKSMQVVEFDVRSDTRWCQYNVYKLNPRYQMDSCSMSSNKNMFLVTMFC